MNLQTAIAKIIEKQDLSQVEMASVMTLMMNGDATSAQMGAFLVGLRMKGETVDEITGAASVMRSLASGVDISGLPYTVDIVGTGGDCSNTFNISTASMFVAAAAGCHVAKHGNRSVSSKSGSADLLEAAGVNLNVTTKQVEQAVRDIGLGFMFAPTHHQAMKHAIGVRKDIAIRTIFNILGPLTNPAGVKNQLLGVFDRDLCRPLAEVLQKLGSKHVMVVHSKDGMDEISIAAPTFVCELVNDQLIEYEINPTDFDLAHDSLNDIKVQNTTDSLKMVQSVLDNQDSAAKDIVLLNAGAAIYCADRAESIEAGMELAKAAIKTGQANQKMKQLINL